MPIIEKLIKRAGFFIRVLSAVRRGRISLALREIAMITPRWLFRYHKAYAVVADDLQISDTTRKDIYVKMATPDDAEEITRINHMSPKRVRAYLSNGAVAFLAGVKSERPGAVLFRASGKCYIQGVSWLHDFGPDSSYSFGVSTAPEARNHGLQSALVAAQAKYEYHLGTRHFYRLLEFTNDLAYDVAYHLGYRPAMIIYYFQLLKLRCAIEKSFATGKATWQVTTRVPDEKCVLKI